MSNTAILVTIPYEFTNNPILPLIYNDIVHTIIIRSHPPTIYTLTVFVNYAMADNKDMYVIIMYHNHLTSLL